MELSEDDVLQILKLIDESTFDYFQLEVGELKITVSKGEPIPLAGSSASVSAAPSLARPTAAPHAAPAAAPAPQAQATKLAPKAAAITDGMVPITAPILGTFYALRKYEAGNLETYSPGDHDGICPSHRIDIIAAEAVPLPMDRRLRCL